MLDSLFMKSIASLVEETQASYTTFAYWYDPMYAVQNRKVGPYRKGAAKLYSRLIHEVEAKSVLDCACGTGDPLIGLVLDRSVQGVNLYGSDANAAMLEKFQANAAEVAVSVDVRISRWQDLPEKFADRERDFDLVICPGHGFFHLITREEMVAALRAIASVTRRGGYVAFDSTKWDPDWRTVEPERFYAKAEDNQLGVIYARSVHYHRDMRAVCGDIQVKRVFVLEEAAAGVREVVSFNFFGAPYSQQVAIGLAEEAGLIDVRPLDPIGDEVGDMGKYLTLLARRP